MTKVVDACTDPIVATSFVTMPEAPHKPYDSCAIDNTKLCSRRTPGVQGDYNWKFVWIPAGEAVFDVVENKNDYEVKVVGKTYDSYDYFLKVRFFYSRIDKNTLSQKLCEDHWRGRLP